MESKKTVYGQRCSWGSEGPKEHQIQRNWPERHNLDLTRDNEVRKAGFKEKMAGGPEWCMNSCRACWYHELDWTGINNVVLGEEGSYKDLLALEQYWLGSHPYRAQAKNWEPFVTSFSHTPHPIYQQILLVLLSSIPRLWPLFIIDTTLVWATEIVS